MTLHEEDIKERWHDLTSWVVEDVRSRWWDRIRASYMEPHRHYHTLKYLYSMLHFYDQYKDKFSNRYACAYAIFFHTIVYDPKSKDNEAQSAAVFKQFSKETTLDDAGYIADLIEKTATHCTDAHTHPESCGVDDVHYFLDFDMAILGATRKDYDEYRKKIRQEYSHLDDAAYKSERLRVLRLFLQIPNIYATEEFRQRFEEKARANVQREIKELEAA